MPDALILAGPGDLAAALAGGARVLLAPEGEEGVAAQLSRLSQTQQARLYVPPSLADAAPWARVALECPADGQPVFPPLRRHALRFGTRGAAIVRPLAQYVTLSPDRAAIFAPLPGEAIETEIHFSRAALCACAARQDGENVIFSLFDTARTIARRRALCRKLGLECIVLLG